MLRNPTIPNLPQTTMSLNLRTASKIIIAASIVSLIWSSMPAIASTSITHIKEETQRLRVENKKLALEVKQIRAQKRAEKEAASLEKYQQRLDKIRIRNESLKAKLKEMRQETISPSSSL